jgi:hypothetical protein
MAAQLPRRAVSIVTAAVVTGGSAGAGVDAPVGAELQCEDLSVSTDGEFDGGLGRNGVVACGQGDGGVGAGRRAQAPRVGAPHSARPHAEFIDTNLVGVAALATRAEQAAFAEDARGARRALFIDEASESGGGDLPFSGIRKALADSPAVLVGLLRIDAVHRERRIGRAHRGVSIGSEVAQRVGGPGVQHLGGHAAAAFGEAGGEVSNGDLQGIEIERRNDHGAWVRTPEAEAVHAIFAAPAVLVGGARGRLGAPSEATLTAWRTVLVERTEAGEG